MASPYDGILVMLRTKLDAAVAERDALKAQVDAFNARVEAKTKFAPKKPTMSAEGYDARIAELELQHRSSRLTLQQEKEMIRTIEELKRIRASLGEYAEFAKELDDAHGARKVASAAFGKAAAAVRELRSGVRKLEALQRVQSANPLIQVKVEDMIVEDIPIQGEHVGRLIGRKGAGLHEIETACGVVLDVEERAEGGTATGAGAVGAGGGGGGYNNNHKSENKDKFIRITGLADGIASAKARIAEVTAQEEISFSLSPVILGYLLGRGGSSIHDMEDRLGVHVRVEKETNKAHVRGLPSNVAAFRSAIADAEKNKAVVVVEGRVLPAVIGKSGVNFKRMFDELHVQVDIARPSVPAGATSATGPEAGPAHLTLVYVGEESAAAVITRAKEFIHSLVNENTEHEEAIPIPRDSVAWLVGNAGERIRTFSKDSGVYARVSRKDEAPQYDYKGQEAVAVLRGTHEALARAKVAFAALMGDYAKSTTAITISASQIRAFIGPSGANIKKLRTETGAQIEVDEAGATPRGETASAAATTSATGAGAGASKPSSSSSATTSGDKNKKKDEPADDKKGAERRRVNRADEAGLPVGAGLVSIRGEEAAVIAAQAAVRAFLASFRELRLPVSAGLIQLLMRNKAEMGQAIETETGASIGVIRDAEAAAAAIQAAAHPVGKNGKMLGAMQVPRPATLSYGAMPAGFVTVGGTESQVQAAQAKIIGVAASTAERTVPIYDSFAVGEVVGKGGATIKVLQEETGADIDVDKPGGVIRIIGAPAALDAAEAKVRAIFEKYARENSSLTVDKALLPSLIGKGGANIRVLQDETGAQVHVDASTGNIRVHGPEASVAAACAKILAICKLDEGSISDEMIVDPSIVGRLIGKGGANIRKLGEAHGVSVGCDADSGRISLRGKPEGVASCKVDLRRQIREASKQEIEIEMPQERLKNLIGPKGSYLRSFETACHISIDLPREREGQATVSVRIRGSPIALEKGKAALGALAAGRIVRLMARIPAHVDALRHDVGALARLQAAGVHIHVFGAELVDATDPLPPTHPSTSCLLVEGGASGSASSDDGVTKTVSAVDRYFAQRLGANYQVVNVPSGLESSLSGGSSGASSNGAAAGAGAGEDTSAAAAPASSSTLASITANGVVGAQFEAASGYVALWSTQASAVTDAKAKLATIAGDFAQRHGEVLADDWMVPTLIGKKGAGIQALETEVGCKIQFERESRADGKRVILLSAASASALSDAKTKVEAKVSSMAKRRILLSVPPSAFGSLIGKGGVTIKALQEETGASLDLDRDIGSVAIRGPTEEAVADAKARIIDIVTEAGFDEDSVHETTDTELASLCKVLTKVHEDDLSAVVGQRGSVIQQLEDDFDASIKADRNTSTIVVRSGSADNVTRVVAAIQKIISNSQAERTKLAEQEKAQAANAAHAAANRASAAAAESAASAVSGYRGPALPIGAAPLTEEERLRLMSKNARRRAKQREQRKEEEETASVPVVAAPVAVQQHAKASGVHANAAPAVVAHSHQQQQNHAAPVQHAVVHHAPAAPAPAPVQHHAAPAGTKQAPSSDDILQKLLGNQFRSLLASVGAAPAVPGPSAPHQHHAPTAVVPTSTHSAAPSVTHAAPAPVVPVAYHQQHHAPTAAAAVRGMPPPGLTATAAPVVAAKPATAAAALLAKPQQQQQHTAPPQQHKAAPAPAPAPAPAAHSGPVWGAPKATGSANASVSAVSGSTLSLESTLAALGLSHHATDNSGGSNAAASAASSGATTLFPALGAPAATPVGVPVVPRSSAASKTTSSSASNNNKNGRK